ncbi:extracellular solute-binding protein [Microlunatus sp. GCM10028923]|uniref:extracellular solute-binding protein n=1 Tax=Microlunatus sp. GCM10028923 TaxID=3273400 RepID=UPI00360E3388
MDLHGRTQLSRRGLLGGGAVLAGTVGVAGLGGLAGCSTGGGGDDAAVNAAVKLPTHKPYEGVEPDLAGDETVLDGYLKYPSDPKQVSTEAPGDGNPVTFMTNIPGAIPPPASDNAFWTELNNRLGSPLEISMASNDEYADKFATRVAGNDLPDLINIPPTTAQLPGLLKAKARDLTEFLSGDAVQQYPFLANLPEVYWRGCVFNGGIYGVPVPRGMARTSLPLYREDLLAAKGIKDPAPKNFQEFFDLCVEMTDQRGNRWAWSTAPTNYVKQMLGIPYLWAEEGGTFTSANEHPRNTDALEAVRKLVEAGVVNPDAFTSGASARKQWFNGGIVSFDLDSFVAWNQYYADNTAGDAFAVNMLDVPGFDDGEGTPWLGAALNNITAINAQTKHAPETLLKIANWMAAPFGTQEYLFRKFGVEGRHYALEGSDPIPNKVGVLETGIGLQYVCDSPMALYLAGHPEVPEKQQKIQQKIAPRLVANASYGLYSDTMSKKGAIIDGPLNDLSTQIVLGKQPVSAWETGVKDWLAAGGEDIRSELQQAHADVNGG